ncbi:MAG: hypothetical protein EA352_04905 [Gemmatimonadales bacterium]|nr:MAG: hypothetical protein EA352_04905 [Gemmatimonadales bacterium]
MAPDPCFFRTPTPASLQGRAEINEFDPPRSEAPAPATAPDPETPALPSLPARIVQVFFSPGDLFQALRHAPGWGLGALVVGALLAAIGVLVPGLFGLEAFEETIRDSMVEAGQDVPADVSTWALVSWTVGVAAAAIFWPVVAVLSAGLYALVFLFLFGYEGSFRQLLNITAHALLVPAVAAVLLIPLRVVTGDFTASLTAAAFFPFLEDGFLLTLLTFTDLFNLWCYALVGLGAALMDGRKSVGQGVTISVATALIITVVVAAVVNAFSG